MNPEGSGSGSGSEENLDSMDHSGFPRATPNTPSDSPAAVASGVIQPVVMSGFPDAVYPSSTGPLTAQRRIHPGGSCMERFTEKTTPAPERSQAVGFGTLGTQGEFICGPATPFPDAFPRPAYPEFPQGPYSDWQYEQRRTMQEIVPNLFLGPLAAASRNSLANMLAAGLTHVICVRAPIERGIVRTNHPDHFEYMVVEMEDKSTENIIRHFEPVNNFINAALESGGKVLVHGNGGCCRSAVLVIAYIMNKYGVSLPEAYTHTQHKRFCICPPTPFLNQLREYEPIYRARHIVAMPIPDPDDAPKPAGAPRKRSLSDSEDNDEQEPAPPQPQFLKRNANAYEGMDQD